MQRRSNEFQQLVLLLQNQLAGQRVAVTESKLLMDMQTKTATEVDVCVEVTVQGGIPVCLGFECTAEARPATVEWVREMAGKHSSLPVTKTILVSKSGFTAEAKRSAEAKSIVTLTYEEAAAAEWRTLVTSLNERLRIGSFTFEPRGGVVTADGGPLSISETSLVRRVSSGQEMTLRDYVLRTLHRRDLWPQVLAIG